MSLEIAYAAMGGDLETVRGRLLTDERIEKFAKIFLQDTSMQTLESALEAGDLPEAYRGAHTLKGVSRDLGFTPLFEAAAALSDALRLDDAGVPAKGGGGSRADAGRARRVCPGGRFHRHHLARSARWRLLLTSRAADARSHKE